MNAREWPLFAAEVEATFRGDLEADRDAALRHQCGAMELDVAQAILRRLVIQGQVWMPTAAEFVAALRREVGDGWDFRRLLAGRSVAEQMEYDRGMLQRAVEARRVPGVLGP